jgi:hypothetical protein
MIQLIIWLLGLHNAPVVVDKPYVPVCTYPEYKSVLKRKYGANITRKQEINYLIDCCTEVNGRYIRNCRELK